MPIHEYYSGYEIITIPEGTEEDKAAFAKWRYVESPWVTVADLINGRYYQYHKETGEERDVPENWFAP